MVDISRKLIECNMQITDRGLLEHATPDQRASIVTELCGIIDSMACDVEDVCDGARDFEKSLNRLLYGNSRENTFNRFDRRW